MSIKIENDEGEEMIAYTQAELDAEKEKIETDYKGKLAEKDAHVAEKLKEFQQGKTAQELKDIERDNAIAEAKKIAGEATERVTASETRRLDSLKKIAMERYVGNDPELTKKFEESWGLVNLEIKDDADIMRKAELAANISGFNSSGNVHGNMPMSGGYAPNFVKNDTKEKEASYGKFKDELGLGEFLKKPEGN